MSRPRARKPQAQVREARQAAAHQRWRKLSAEERREATAPATKAAIEANRTKKETVSV